MSRVVVTGLGIVSPLGVGEWILNRSAITHGKSGLRKIRASFDASDLPSQIAGEVPLTSESEKFRGALDISKYIEHKEQKKMDPLYPLRLYRGGRCGRR